MYAFYTLKDNTKLGIFLWSDFMENKLIREFAEVDVLDENYQWTEEQNLMLPLCTDPRGVYVEYNGQNVYLNDFDYIPYEKLMQKIQECIDKDELWLVSNDQILATFLRESDKVGIVGNLPVLDTILPGMRLGMLYSGKEMNVLTVLTEKRYKKPDWHYKVTLMAEDESLRGIVVSQNVYFSDLCSLLKSGHYRLVNIDEYKRKNKMDVNSSSEKD